MLAYLGYEPPSKESLGAAPFSEFGDDNDSVIDFDVMSMTSSVASSIPASSPRGASAVADGDVDVGVDYDDADSVASKDSIASTIYRAYARDHPEDPTGSAKFADPAERRSVIRKYRAAAGRHLRGPPAAAPGDAARARRVAGPRRRVVAGHGRQRALSPFDFECARAAGRQPVREEPRWREDLDAFLTADEARRWRADLDDFPRERRARPAARWWTGAARVAAAVVAGATVAAPPPSPAPAPRPSTAPAPRPPRAPSALPGAWSPRRRRPRSWVRRGPAPVGRARTRGLAPKPRYA
ncbi:hypothetical protein JL720_12571 [Aureococcus anophagefferens]|nr:hypothetical protein JL720_12571 [Aureococcus anophagefferens]